MTTNLAAQVKAWRTRQSLTAEQAALRLDLPRRTLEGIEQGRPFRYATMLMLAMKAAHDRDDQPLHQRGQDAGAVGGGSPTPRVRNLGKGAARDGAPDGGVRRDRPADGAPSRARRRNLRREV